MNQGWLILKKTAQRLSILATLYHPPMPSIHYWCQDESRFGLKTITRRRLTLRGVKPHSPVPWSFKSSYLYGRVEPLTGESCFLELSHSKNHRPRRAEHGSVVFREVYGKTQRS